jgi:hypothetical protein
VGRGPALISASHYAEPLNIVDASVSSERGESRSPPGRFVHRKSMSLAGTFGTVLGLLAADVLGLSLCSVLGTKKGAGKRKPIGQTRRRVNEADWRVIKMPSARSQRLSEAGSGTARKAERSRLF